MIQPSAPTCAGCGSRTDLEGPDPESFGQYWCPLCRGVVLPAPPRRRAPAHYHTVAFLNRPDDDDAGDHDPEGTRYLRAQARVGTYSEGDALMRALATATLARGGDVSPPCKSGEAVLYEPDGSELHLQTLTCADFGGDTARGCLSEQYPTLPPLVAPAGVVLRPW